jgi:hypothetical protein
MHFLYITVSIIFYLRDLAAYLAQLK